MLDSSQSVNPSALGRANGFSRMFFYWIYSLVSLGNRRPIEQNDIHNLR